MSKLSIIRESLKENAEVIVVGVKEQDYFRTRNLLGNGAIQLIFMSQQEMLYILRKNCKIL